MDAALNVKLGADPSGLVAGLKTAESAVNTTKISLGSLKDLLKQLESERPQIVDDKQLIQYNQTISALKTNIQDLEHVGVAGFDATGKKIEDFGKKVRESQTELREVRHILEGFGAAGVASLAFDGLTKALEFATTAFGDTDKAAEFLNKTLEESSSKVQGEVSGIKDLVSIATTETNTRELRLRAFKELQEQYPNAFKNMSLEKTSLEDLSKATDNLTNALIRQAQIKGLEGAISKISGEINELLASSTEEIVKSAGIFGSLKAILSGGILGGAEFLPKLFTDQLGDASSKLSKLQDQLKATLTTSLTQGDGDILGKKLGTEHVVDSLAATKRALEEIVKLENDLAKPDTRPLFKRLSDSLDPSQAQLIETKIAEVLRDGVKNGIDKAITDKDVALLREQLRRLGGPDLKTVIDTRVEVNPIVEGDVATFEKTFPPTLEGLLKKLPPIKTDIKVDPSLVLINTDFAKANEKIKSTIGAAGANLAEGLAADFGKAFAGVKNPFGDIAALLGEGLQEIGKQLIIVGGLSQLIQKLLPTVFTPAGALTSIAVGALAIAAGAALKAISSTKGVKAFAEGGIVTGPTNALIGEAGPEVVFPLDKLNRFLKGNTTSGSMNVSGILRAQGTDLVAVINRTDKNQRMV